MMLSFTVANNEFIFIADVSMAFLHTYLYPYEQLYCRPPRSFENHSVFGGKVMRLVKALYGARQASKRFWEHLHAVLSTTMGMTRYISDSCVWILDAGTNEIHVKGLTNGQTNGFAYQTCSSC